MNFIERILLKRLCVKLVKQGYTHKDNITEYYKIINNAAREEFTEENNAGLVEFLSECFKDSTKNLE